MKLSVIGTGYLGATHAAAMASLGFEVIGLDVDPDKVAAISRGHVPFHEPGLSELLVEQVDAGRLRMTTSYEEVCAEADIHFVCVGTPQCQDSGAADLRYVDAAFEELARCSRRDALIVGKSTVPVGTAERLAARVAELAAPGVHLEVAWNPEFLREGHAVEDTISPNRLVFGVTSARAEQALRAVYAQPIAAGSPVIVTDYPTAELVKVAANSFLATKISFINAVSEITETVGGDITTLAEAIGMDERIGRQFLNAGVGFGGGCLPKDIRAFQVRARELGLEDSLAFLAEVDAVNQRARDRIIERVESMVGGAEGAAITILGAAFKPDSDDVRDSPALEVATRLDELGARVCVIDPQAVDNARQHCPGLRYATDLEDAVRGADALVLVTEWSEFCSADPERLGRLVAHRRILDGRNVLDLDAWHEAGWEAEALGRCPSEEAQAHADNVEAHAATEPDSPPAADEVHPVPAEPGAVALPLDAPLPQPAPLGIPTPMAAPRHAATVPAPLPASTDL